MISKQKFYEFFKKIPKAELHLHIEAVISFETIRKFYLRKNPGVSEEDAELEIDRIFSYCDLNGFIQAFLKVQDLYEGVSDFDCVFDDLKNYIVRNGISYAEVFIAPSAFLKKGFSFPEMVENFRKNIRRIKEETGVDIRMLVDVSRTFGAENAEKNLDLVLANRCPEIIGIGLGGAESKGPARDFGGVFERARQNGLVTVAHAGEDVGPESVWDSIDILKAARIGHGISSAHDEKLMDALSERGIPLEICPTSNVFTQKYVRRLSEHPAKRFFDRNICVTLNTDDPLFFHVELLDEFWNAYSKMNFRKSDLKELIRNSFSASFLTEPEKKKFLDLVEEKWKS